MSITTQARPLPLPSDQDSSGRTLGDEEIRRLTEAIRSGTLTSTKGALVKQLEARWAEMLGAKFAYACSHGTAAIHCAVAACDPEPGDEIVTSPITDMGALTPILYQGAIPVFCDVDPATCNVTPAAVERVLSERTKAVVVTHLFGNPCDTNAIVELCRPRKHCRDRGLCPSLSGPASGTTGGHDRRHRRLQPAARQAHHDGRGRPGRHQQCGLCPPHVPVHQQSLGLWRRAARSLFPGAELPHDRAARSGRRGSVRQVGGRRRPADRAGRRI